MITIRLARWSQTSDETGGQIIFKPSDNSLVTGYRIFPGNYSV